MTSEVEQTNPTGTISVSRPRPIGPLAIMMPQIETAPGCRQPAVAAIQSSWKYAEIAT